MKRVIWIIATLIVIASAAGCNKGNEPEPQQNQEQQDKDKSKDPEDSTDPGASEDPGAPLENLIVSLPQIDYTQDGDGIWRARVTFTIATEARDVYFVWGKDAALDDNQIIEKYKPAKMDATGNGALEYTIPELLPVFQTINFKVVAEKDGKVLSESKSFDTFKSDEYEQTIYLEADEATASAYKDGFSITMVKDSYLFANKEGGYKVTAKVSAPGNWDGNNKKYTVPDDKYELDGTSSFAEFKAIIPGVGEYAASGAATLEISSNKMLGTWEIAITMDAEFDDWTQFKRVKQVVFTLYDKTMEVTSVSLENDLFPMAGNVDFTPDSPDGGGSFAALMTRQHNGDQYKVLLWGANDTSSDSRYADVLYVPLVVPEDFIPGEDSWSRLDGTYSTPDNGFLYYSPFQVAVPFLNIFQQAVNTGLSYARYDKAKWSALDPEGNLADYLVGLVEATVQSAMPDDKSQVAKLSASKDGAWLQLEVDLKDRFTSYHVRCTTVIMTDKIVTAE